MNLIRDKLNIKKNTIFNQDDFSEFLNVILFGLRTLWTTSKLHTISLFILSGIGGLAPLLEVWAITGLVNELIQGMGSNGTLERNVIQLLPWLSLLVMGLFLRHSIESFQPFLAANLNEQLNESLSQQLYQKALSLKLEMFETPKYYDQLERAQKATGNRLVRALEGLGNLVTAIFQLIIIIYMVGKIGIVPSIILLLGTIPLVISIANSNKIFTEVNYRHSPFRRKMIYWRNQSTTRESATELRLFGLGNFFLKKWHSMNNELIDELFIARRKMAHIRIQSNFAIYILIGFVIVWTIYIGLQGSITIGLLVATLYLLNQYERVLITLGYQGGDVLNHFYADFKNVPKYLKLEHEEVLSESMPPITFQKEIEFKNVSFTYPGKKEPALQSINLHIKQGERLALVGENGSGKTTLTCLLLGLFQPTEGVILIDGLDLSEIPPNSWRIKTAAVFQNYIRYHLTVKENIGNGDVARLENQEEIVQAAQKSGVHEVITNLPNSYKTLLGKEYEKSIDLSGGEWQKLAIARSYFRDAELLVLDEPAAALDANSELEVYSQFSDVSQGRTVLLISHRLGSARIANRVIYLHKGQVIQEGTHEELIAVGGPYAEMYEQQAEWYKEQVYERE
ncbi:ABC transporter ATP-binding protein [Pseudalkalibacillus sp. R45]|uniref:ABC transporter ATP-binding protein n=1 Tax=Pseudalkalibacillus sp. R45 TaxID=3457433 RepID=UPI003FCEE58D